MSHDKHRTAEQPVEFINRSPLASDMNAFAIVSIAIEVGLYNLALVPNPSTAAVDAPLRPATVVTIPVKRSSIISVNSRAQLVEPPEVTYRIALLVASTTNNPPSVLTATPTGFLN
jgi:hypothetical protein